MKQIWMVVAVLIVCSMAGSSTMGSCRDGANRLLHARKLLQGLAGNLLDAFVGLVNQYNREFPSHYPNFSTWMEGYKSAMVRTDEVLALQAALASWEGSNGSLFQTYAREFASAVKFQMCDSQDLSLVIQSWKSQTMTDQSVMAQKKAFFWDDFAFLKNQTWAFSSTPITFEAWPGLGYALLTNFDQGVVNSLSGANHP